MATVRIQVLPFLLTQFLFAGRHKPLTYGHKTLRNSASSRIRGAEYKKNESAGMFYEHCWCDGSGYDLCKF